MGLYKSFELSSHLTETGAKCSFPEAVNEDGTIPAIIVARSHSSNQLFMKAVAAVYTPEFNKRLANGDLSDSEAADANLEVMLQGTVMGWENIYDRDGAPLMFTRENAKRVLSDLPEVVSRLRVFSAELNNYLKSAEDAAVKN